MRHLERGATFLGPFDSWVLTTSWRALLSCVLTHTTVQMPAGSRSARSLLRFIEDISSDEDEDEDSAGSASSNWNEDDAPKRAAAMGAEDEGVTR